MLAQHPGIRPSTITSQPTLSTGSADLDRLLTHEGLPLGNSLLIEENGTTDFSSVLLKVYAAQGIVHNRNAGKLNTHVIVIGSDQQWGGSFQEFIVVPLKNKKEQGCNQRI